MLWRRGYASAFMDVSGVGVSPTAAGRTVRVRPGPPIACRAIHGNLLNLLEIGMNGQGDIRQVVTVCITTYNREDLLPFAIQSVLDQTYANLEILVVDDCSNDGTSDVVAEFMKKDERIKYVLHEQNKGLAAARNTAIFKAKGRYFTFLDDDDEWMPEFVEKFVAIAQQYGPDYVFCCGHVEYDRSGRRINLIPHYYGKLTDAIRRGNVPPPSSQFYFTEELKKIGGYNEQIMSGVDHDLWLTLAFHGYRVKVLEEALTVITPRAPRSDNRMTTNWQRRFNGVLASLEIWRPNIVKHFGEAFFEHFIPAWRLWNGPSQESIGNDLFFSFFL